MLSIIYTRLPLKTIFGLLLETQKTMTVCWSFYQDSIGTDTSTDPATYEHHPIQY